MYAKQRIVAVPHRSVQRQLSLTVVQRPGEVRIRHAEEMAVDNLEPPRDHGIPDQTRQFGVELEAASEGKGVRPETRQIRHVNTGNSSRECRRSRDSDGALYDHLPRPTHQLESLNGHRAGLFQVKPCRCDQLPLRAP